MVRQPLERHGDRRQGTLVAGEEVVRRRGVGGVATTGTQQQDLGARRGGRRPRAGDAGVPVHDEVEGQLQNGGVERADGAGPHARGVLRGQAVADRVDVDPVRVDPSTATT